MHSVVAAKEEIQCHLFSLIIFQKHLYAPPTVLRGCVLCRRCDSIRFLRFPLLSFTCIGEWMFYFCLRFALKCVSAANGERFLQLQAEMKKERFGSRLATRIGSQTRVSGAQSIMHIFHFLSPFLFSFTASLRFSSFGGSDAGKRRFVLAEEIKNRGNISKRFRCFVQTNILYSKRVLEFVRLHFVPLSRQHVFAENYYVSKI